MTDFFSPDAIFSLDPQKTLATTDSLIDQLETAWNEVSALEIPHHLTAIKNIVFCGMGASIYGALVLKAIQGSQMPYPSEMVSDYHLPAYVNEHTLIVLTSYSGSTEEVLSCAHEALEKKAKMLVLTRGGALAQFARDNGIPAYIFDGERNFSGVPRHGCGYTIFGLIGLLNKTGVITIADEELEEALTRLKEKKDDLRERAEQDAVQFLGKVPVIFAAEHLSGNGQILRNQFNESSKTYADYYLVPDLNHHLMEGLQFPSPSPLQFLVIHSKNYSESIQKRMQLTAEVLKQNNQPLIEFLTSSQTIYDDVLEILLYGSYLSLALAFAYHQNPAPNPYVDWFKSKLSE